MSPLVSVVTPVYNGETYLAACIESVLSQSYSNWEYVIVNNCSTDRTLDIASDYAARCKDRAFWDFHRQKLKELGYPLSWLRLAAYVGFEVASKGLNLHLALYKISDGRTGSVMR